MEFLHVSNTLAPAFMLFLAFLIFVVAYRSIFGDRRHLPPGPKGLPLIGNVHQLPKDHQERAFFQWGQVFGDLVYVRLFRTPTIIINSAQVAKDLLDNCGSIYSGRPPFVVTNQLMGMDGILPFMPYGPRFRKVRTWFRAAFQPQAVMTYRPSQLRETHIFLNGLVDRPDQYQHHLERFGAAVLMDVTYGHRVMTDNDLYVQVAHDTVSGVSIGGNTVGAVLIDAFPILKHYPSWIPGGAFKRHAQKVHRSARTMLDAPFDPIERKMKTTGAQPCFISDLLGDHWRRGGLTSQDKSDIKGAAATFYAAGSETLTAVMTTFILAMVRHRDVFKKAREEMDLVVGLDRLPDFGDRALLPYLDCIIKEVYRWNPAGPLAIPHAATQDGEYRGYEIPARSVIIPNIWAMSRNASIYPNPEMFMPERFMDTTDEDLIDPKNLVFGFGRRICPAKDFADLSVYLLTSNIVATMNITKARDVKGNEITPPLEFTAGIISMPKPFDCVVTPRSSQVVDYIRRLVVEN